MSSPIKNNVKTLSKCKLVQAQIHKYLLGVSMSDDLVNAVEKHISVCTVCTKELSKKQNQLENMMHVAQKDVQERGSEKASENTNATNLLDQLSIKHSQIIKNSKSATSKLQHRLAAESISATKPTLKDVIEKTAPKNKVFNKLAWSAGAAVMLIMMNHALSDPFVMLGKKVFKSDNGIEKKSTHHSSKEKINETPLPIVNDIKKQTLEEQVSLLKKELREISSTIKTNAEKAEDREIVHSEPSVEQRVTASKNEKPSESIAPNSEELSSHLEDDIDMDLQAIKDAAPIRYERSDEVVDYVYQLLSKQLNRSEGSYVNPLVQEKVGKAVIAMESKSNPTKESSEEKVSIPKKEKIAPKNDKVVSQKLNQNKKTEKTLKTPKPNLPVAKKEKLTGVKKKISQVKKRIPRRKRLRRTSTLQSKKPVLSQKRIQGPIRTNKKQTLKPQNSRIRVYEA